ncbi:hypothetical protein Sjap_022712 [Stephania japonica]|uniref:Uncharacterized protein n=1 Tax=Stephania japonica TaxID=461633 RepID=A0AAP0HV81_9MAGN
MGVTIENSVWEPNPQTYILIFSACLLSILLPPYFSKNPRPPSSSSSPLFDLSSSPSFLTNFLLTFSLASVIGGLGSVFGEGAFYGSNKEEIVVSLCVGCFAACVFGALLGVLSDVIGQKKICVLFCVLHIFVGVWRSVSVHPNAWIATISLALASFIFMFSFETLVVKEHEKLGHRTNLLSDTFWLMEFYQSACFIGSQMFANFLVCGDAEKSIGYPSLAVALLSVICLICIVRGWKESPTLSSIKEYKVAFSACILHDRRVWLLMCTQSCLQFSNSIFWILWAPIIVADGRGVHLGMLFPCWMGAKMLGSTVVPWLLNGSSQSQEDWLVGTFLMSGLIFSIVAYDYQEVGVLVALFCLYHASVGLISPLLARLRTMYIPSDLRGGMISLSVAPAYAALLLVLIQLFDGMRTKNLSLLSSQGSYRRSLGNSSAMAFAAFGLFVAAGCMHMLKKSRATRNLSCAVHAIFLGRSIALAGREGKGVTDLNSRWSIGHPTFLMINTL